VLAAIAGTCIAGSAVAEEGSFPRAEAAASALATADAVAAVVDAPATMDFVRAIGGRSAEAALAWMAGNAFSAIGAVAVADDEWQRVAAIAERDGDARRHVAALTQRIDVALSEGDYARCEALSDTLSKVATTIGDDSALAFAQTNLGVLARRQGRLDAALAYQQRALDLYRRANDAIGTAQALTNLATVQRDRGDFAKALDLALEALSIRERTGDKLEIAYRNVGILYREVEDGAAARTYFERALAAADRRGSPAAYAPVVGAFAGLLNDLNEPVAAERAAREALAIDVAIGDKPHQGLEHLEVGRALLGQHRADDAEAELDAALALGRELGQREIVARALLHLADVALAAHDRLRAHGLLDEAIAELESARLRPQLALAYSMREQLARADHDDAAALRFAHKYASEREELLGIRASRQLSALEARHARAESEQRVALLAKDNELQSALLEKERLQRRRGRAARGASHEPHARAAQRGDRARAHRARQCERQARTPGDRAVPDRDHRLDDRRRQPWA
jgi:tetratricopeptide (TPR) repeat protein